MSYLKTFCMIVDKWGNICVFPEHFIFTIVRKFTDINCYISKSRKQRFINSQRIFFQSCLHYVKVNKINISKITAPDFQQNIYSEAVFKPEFVSGRFSGKCLSEIIPLCQVTPIQGLF